MAAVLAAGEHAALSHLCAATLWRVWRRGTNGIDVVTPDRRRSRPGVRIHGSRILDPTDVTKREGIPVTTVPRTLVDLADVMTAERLANVIHEAAFRNVFDARATREAINRAHGRRGTSVLARALAAHESGSAGTRSSLEDRFLALVRQARLPEPQVNVHVPAGGQEIEVDFHWPDRRLCVEIDGPGHGRPRTQHEDRARDEALHRAGHRVVRLREEDLELGARVVERLTE